MATSRTADTARRRLAEYRKGFVGAWGSHHGPGKNGTAGCRVQDRATPCESVRPGLTPARTTAAFPWKIDTPARQVPGAGRVRYGGASEPTALDRHLTRL
jgi:hypothetical protein